MSKANKNDIQGNTAQYISTPGCVANAHISSTELRSCSRGA